MHWKTISAEREIQQEVGQLDWDMSIIIMMEKKLEKKKTFPRSFYLLTFGKD